MPVPNRLISNAAPGSLSAALCRDEARAAVRARGGDCCGGGCAAPWAARVVSYATLAAFNTHASSVPNCVPIRPLSLALPSRCCRRSRWAERARTCTSPAISRAAVLSRCGGWRVVACAACLAAQTMKQVKEEREMQAQENQSAGNGRGGVGKEEEEEEEIEKKEEEDDQK